MSGATSRSGFAFQDLLLAERVLSLILAQRAASIGGVDPPSASMRFGVEAAPLAGRTPEWDILQIEDAELVLEEAKSGVVDADDRWALWLRVRRTAQGLVRSGTRLSVRLAVNADALPGNAESWRALAVQSQTAPGRWFTPPQGERRRAVRSAEDLANEAIHVLTSLDADPASDPMTIDDARSLLARFSLNDRHCADSVETDVRNHLDTLARSIGVGELLSGLRGEISRRAESSDPTARTFTPADLMRSFTVLDRLAEVDPATLRRWQSLRAVATANEVEADVPGDGLAYQDWKSLQGAAAVALGASPPNAVALVGRGGLGKSILLRRWLAERRGAADEALLLSTDDLSTFGPDHIAAALDLGAFAARQRGHRLVVGVDGLENAPDDQRRVTLLGALRAVACSDVSVCITCRVLEWRSARGSSETITGWVTVELDEWPADRVRDQVNATARPNLAADLLRLLRTPLLLDLFLRSFGRGADVPPGLQTRHGLLRAYFDRRIIPPNDERSADRRVTLMAVSAEEAGGTHSHLLTGAAARDLTSEGLFSLTRGGLRSFRHALLRDFTMMIWACDRDQSAERIAETLDGVQASLVQFGALRAVLEAAAEGTPTGTSILSALKPPLLFHAGTILGEFEDLSKVRLELVVDCVRDEHRSEFLRALLAAIKLDRNVAWASVFGRLPDDAGWARETSWVTGDLLVQCVDTLEALREGIVSDTHLGEDLGSRLRTWSLTPCLFAELSSNGGLALGRVAKLLAYIDPSPKTLSWLVQIATVGSWSRFWVLSELPHLVQRMGARGADIDDGLLRVVYVASAGLRDDGGRLRDDATLPRDAMTSYDRVRRSLVGEPRTIGLISSRPSAFVAIALDVIAGHEADDADAHTERVRELECRLPNLKWPDPPAGVRELEANAASVAGRLPEGDGDDGLVVDVATDPYWDLGADHEHLLVHVRQLAETSLAERSTFFDDIFWPSVARSRSATARACALDLLTRQDTCPKEAVLDALLLDGRLYVVRCARSFLQRAIRVRWSSLTLDARDVILANIRNCGRKPTGGPYLPGPLLAVVPEDERPGELNVFIELYRLRGWSLEIEQAHGASLVRGRALPAEARPWIGIAGLSDDQQAPWQQLAKWEHGRIAQATASEWSALVATVEILIAGCLPVAKCLLERASLIDRLGEFAAVHAETSGGDRTPRLTSDALQALARWSIDGVGAFARVDVVADCEPFDSMSGSLPPLAELWIGFADLADAVLWEPELKDNEGLNRALFSAIDVVAREPPARLACRLIAQVGGWFRAGRQGKPVLFALLAEGTRDSRALSTGLRFLESFDRTEQHELIELWLATNLSPAISPPREFAREAGTHMGNAAMLRYEGTGATTGSHDILRKLIVAPSTAGLLSDPSIHLLFVGQSVFGAKQAVACGGVPVARSSEFAAWMHECWRVLVPSLDDARGDAPAFALWVFHPVLDAAGRSTSSSELKLTPEDRATWWRTLKTLADAIVREGPSRELSSLFRCMKDSPLLASLDGDEVIDLLVSLSTRTATLSRDSLGFYWDDAISCASAVVESITPNTAEPRTRDRLYALVASWAAPPLAIETSGAVARRLRA